MTRNNNKKRNLNKKLLENNKSISQVKREYWNILNFPTINLDIIKKWDVQKLIYHLKVMFSVEGYCRKDLFNKESEYKFRLKQIDGKTFLKMTRNDFFKMGISGLLILHLEAEILRLHGYYKNENYYEPEELLLKFNSFELRNNNIPKENFFNKKDLFQQLITRKLLKVPSIYELKRFLLTPLPMRVFVPSFCLLNNQENSNIYSYVIPQEQCFREFGNIIPSSPISLPFINALTYPYNSNSPCQENNLICYNLIIDALIQGTLSCLQSQKSQWIYMARNFIQSKEDLLRPDWMCWINDHLIIHGIELPENVELNVGIQNIIDKTHWKDIYYSNLPFKFVYISKGPILRWYVFDPLRYKIILISQDFDLDRILDRLRMIRTVINIYNVLDSIRRNWVQFKINKSTHPLYLTINRDGGTTIEFMGNLVKKSLSTQKMKENFNYDTIRKIYLETSHIKNLIHCVDLEGNLSYPILTKDGSCKIFLHPVGYYYYPKNELEVKSMIKTILQVLKEMHQVNWTHRDIYWGNILRQDNGDWLIIDLELGGPVNEILQFSLWNRWPEQAVIGKPYLACYDIYQVGTLMDELKGTDQYFNNYSKSFIQFKNLLLESAKDNNFTAEMALRHEWLSEVITCSHD
ncbi:hypothetical protein RhiirA1_467002 [Rhizophagus irregularis]|uniref:Protein kinase domain-containing protein n=1 Tax=Rhizophagus irregularis TaxID=588596 RepID=A0A2N0RCS5_9GLOM|nr:hypothetical protein RhiirA1_467002 [Rhizophagus irregularis]